MNECKSQFTFFFLFGNQLIVNDGFVHRDDGAFQFSFCFRFLRLIYFQLDKGIVNVSYTITKMLLTYVLLFCIKLTIRLWGDTYDLKES